MPGPSTYNEWRKLYQSLLLGLGYNTFVISRTRRHRLTDLSIFQKQIRQHHRLLARLERVRRRLDAEAEAGTIEYLETMADFDLDE